MQSPAFPILLFSACLVGLAIVLLVLGNLFNPKRPNPVKQMPYESGMDPIHDTRRRVDVRFHLLAVAFLVFDVELLFLYPWAVAMRPAPVAGPVQAPPGAADGIPHSQDSCDDAGLKSTAPVRPIFLGGMIFVALLALGYVYDWRKGVFSWR
jgi:NADH-quinone oxidoreductase subunit A